MSLYTKSNLILVCQECFKNVDFIILSVHPEFTLVDMNMVKYVNKSVVDPGFPVGGAWTS